MDNTTIEAHKKSIELSKNLMVGTPEGEDAFNKLVSTWAACYRVTLKRLRAKEKRLHELLTWDAPKELYNWEWVAKVTGLVNDVRSKPNDTRYNTNLKIAEALLKSQESR